METTCGSGSYVTSISRSASAAISSLSAATAATSSPINRTVRSNTKLPSYHGIASVFSAQITACTPGSASAAAMSIAATRACGCGLRSTFAYSWRGKRTSELIPLCHPLPGTTIAVELAVDDALPGVRARAEAIVDGPTGVEMEALTAVAVALLTVYDMAKALDRGMVIEGVRLLLKEGGRSGRWEAGGAD